MKIRILDPIDCEVEQATKDELAWLRSLLSYPTEFYIKKQFGSVRKEGRTSAVVKVKGRNQFFLVGFLPRVRAAAQTKGIELEIEGELERLAPSAEPMVAGKELRPDQIRFIQAAVEQQRGVLLAPTGSGKTVVLMGLLSCFPGTKALIITHTKDIVSQTVHELRDHGFPSVCQPSQGDCLMGRIAVATRQSLVETVDRKKQGGNKYPKVKEHHQEWMRDLDILIIDEVHLFGSRVSQYSTILRSTLAPVRLGLTGTAPKNAQIASAMEGALGPTIEEVTYEEGVELDILANVKLELLPVPYRSRLNGAATSDLRTYREFLHHGLITNRTRNRIIIGKASQLVDKGLTVLIFINELDHGNQLLEMAQLFDLETVFLEGATDGNVRDHYKRQLMDGKIRCVISSKIWREGINIPNLGAVILASGRKAELSVLQSIGRGMRKSAGKEKAVIVDLLDPYRFLAEHTVHRLSVYAQHGWL